MPDPSSFGSINEENVYRALTKLRVDFSYQYPLDGGRNVRGGQVIDFILWIPPRPIALYLQSYWHKGARGLEDAMKHAAAERHHYLVMDLWEQDTMTVEDATKSLKAKVI